MDTFEIKVKKNQQVAVEKKIPPPKLTYTYIQSEKMGGLDRIQIVCAESVLIDVHKHAAASSNEVGGVLIGDVYEWDGVYYVKIDACIQGVYMETGPAHARFTADMWAQAVSVREKTYPGKIIVGWYHSHPSMGIFLSGMDLGIHKGFFTSPWHVALVFDAQKQRMGFFIWDNQQIQNSTGFSLTHRVYYANRFKPYPTTQRGVFEYGIHEEITSSSIQILVPAIALGVLAGTILGCYLSRKINRKESVSRTEE